MKENIGAKGDYDTSGNNVYLSKQDLDIGDTISREIREMVDSGIRLLVMVGDEDGICPWQGNLLWMKHMPWKHQSEFNALELKPFTLEPALVDAEPYGGKPGETWHKYSPYSINWQIRHFKESVLQSVSDGSISPNSNTTVVYNYETQPGVDALNPKTKKIEVGRFQAYRNVKFAQVYGAGHGINSDQREVGKALIESFIFDHED